MLSRRAGLSATAGLSCLSLFLNAIMFIFVLFYSLHCSYRIYHVLFLFQGMEYLEKSGIIHRDLAARNVLGKTTQRKPYNLRDL